jgi:hypothetical protein
MIKVDKNERDEFVLRFLGARRDDGIARFGYPPNRLPQLSREDETRYRASVQAGLKVLFDRQNAKAP